MRTNYPMTVLVSAITSAAATLALAPYWHHTAPLPRTRQQPQRPVSKEILATVTAYCPCSICCGQFSDGKTSTGRDAFKTRGVAADPKVIPYGSVVKIPGYGSFKVDDTGGAMRQATKSGRVHIDLRFNSHKQALKFGRKNLVITVEDKI